MKGRRFRPLAAAILSVLTIGAVAFLAVAPISGRPGNVLLHAEEQASPQSPSALPASPRPPAPKAADSKAQEAGSGTTLRVATWNVRDCAAYEPASKTRIPLHDYVARTIKASSADVIVLEEIQSDEGKGGDIALLSVSLAREGWSMPFVAVVNARGEDDLAIFSRYRIADYGPVLDPAEGDAWPRPGIFASVDSGAAEVDIYGFHFKAMGDKKSETARRSQAEALGRHLAAVYGETLSSRAIVLAGDFNTANDTDLEGEASTMSALRLAGDEDPGNDFLAANYRYRPDEPTFADSRYSSILDHILLSPALALGMDRERVEVLKPSPGPGKIPTSDHSLVLVDILLPRGN